MVDKKDQWLVPLSFLGVTTIGVAVCLFAFRQKPARKSPGLSATASVATLSSPLPTASAPAVSWPPEEVFRRAFWRQPSEQDHIVHAQRRETVNDQALQNWQWFLEIRPGPELLRALRDSETFGLVPVATPRPWSEPISSPEPAPAWFPAATPADAGFEILQAPAGRFTLLYRARDNTLFATDTGAGFAPAVERPGRRPPTDSSAAPPAEREAR